MANEPWATTTSHQLSRPYCCRCSSLCSTQLGRSEIRREIEQGDYSLKQVEEARKLLSLGLKHIDSEGTEDEKATFLRSFVRRVEVARNDPKLVIQCDIGAFIGHVGKEKPEPADTDSGFSCFGSPGWIRTSDQLINSQLLYR